MFDLKTKRIIIIEVKWGQTIDNRAVYQVCKYKDKLKILFSKWDNNVQFWIIVSHAPLEKVEELKECGFKLIRIDDLFY